VEANLILDSKKTVCIVGVGFVGLTLSMTLCDFGFEVIGYEKDLTKSENLSRGITDIQEPGMDIKLSSHIKEQSFSMVKDIKDASSANVFIITVGTPLREGSIDLASLTLAIKEILPILKNQDLVIVRSTTAIGTCREVVLPLLKSTGKKVLLAMAPERTVEGNALEEMISLPQIIGALDEQSMHSAKSLFSLIGCECVGVSSLEAAELSKLINNTYRDLTFAFANEVAFVANAFNLSAAEVISAANYRYARSRIPYPGITGGPCLEKDPWILFQSGQQKGLRLRLTESSRIVNEEVVDWFIQKNLSKVQNVKKIAILGLAFKGEPMTRDTRGSAAIPLSRAFVKQFPSAQLAGFDPSDIREFPVRELIILDNPESALENADVVVLLTNSLFWQNIPSQIWEGVSPSCLILDFWKRDSDFPIPKGRKYVSWVNGLDV
jgi:UDP-N-acetyl-D-mannosaminuronic acid dehydrogenase